MRFLNDLKRRATATCMAYVVTVGSRATMIRGMNGEVDVLRLRPGSAWPADLPWPAGEHTLVGIARWPAGGLPHLMSR